MWNEEYLKAYVYVVYDFLPYAINKAIEIESAGVIKKKSTSKGHLGSIFLSYNHGNFRHMQ